MKNLLVGNGINIQFDNKNYTTSQIVLRALKNFDRDDFPSHIIINYPYLMKNYFAELYFIAREIINGDLDVYANCEAERKAIKSFKRKYTSRLTTLKITDIGFEDYYLIHDLCCHKIKRGNPDQFYIREAMKVAYLYSIYNDGNLNELYKLYPNKFIEYLNKFNNIFTTNYDSNIESAIAKNIYHLHGQFDIKSDVYELDSFRNQLPDAPIRNIEIDDTYFYLYSNALSTHCGEYKEFQINQSSSANSCIEKMSEAYKTNPDVAREIDSWINDTNQLTVNIGYAIKLKTENENLKFSDDYHFEELRNISGDLEILGLSPWNDFHIFETINNSDIVLCTYYYFNIEECDIVKNLLPNLESKSALKFSPVKEFWRIIYES